MSGSTPQSIEPARDLDLLNTAVTDAGLEHLVGLTRLQRLNLGYTGVSDTGLKRLKGLTELRSLGLARTSVTDAGVSDLQKALPKVNIDTAWK